MLPALHRHDGTLTSSGQPIGAWKCWMSDELGAWITLAACSGAFTVSVVARDVGKWCDRGVVHVRSERQRIGKFHRPLKYVETLKGLRGLLMHIASDWEGIRRAGSKRGSHAVGANPIFASPSWTEAVSLAAENNKNSGWSWPGA